MIAESLKGNRYSAIMSAESTSEEGLNGSLILVKAVCNLLFTIQLFKLVTQFTRSETTFALGTKPFCWKFLQL